MRVPRSTVVLDDRKGTGGTRRGSPSTACMVAFQEAEEEEEEAEEEDDEPPPPGPNPFCANVRVGFTTPSPSQNSQATASTTLRFGSKDDSTRAAKAEPKRARVVAFRKPHTSVSSSGWRCCKRRGGETEPAAAACCCCSGPFGGGGSGAGRPGGSGGGGGSVRRSSIDRRKEGVKLNRIELKVVRSGPIYSSLLMAHMAFSSKILQRERHRCVIISFPFLLIHSQPFLRNPSPLEANRLPPLSPPFPKRREGVNGR